MSELMPTYPRDRSLCMRKDGPIDCRFQIPGGTLQYNPERDVRFPYIYEVPTHTLVHSPEYVKKILIQVVDTSIEARIEQAKFEKMLSVLLRPNANMHNHSLFELELGTILFARPLTDDGVYHEERDIVEAWCLDGNEFLTYEDLVHLDIVRDLFLGSAEDMTSKAPVPDPNDPGKLTGGTAFEHCGQRAVKESVHQRQRALVGPTSSGKFYDNLEDADEYSLNLEIRGKVTEINARMAMMALKIGAPKDYMQLLQEHADVVNLPRVGVDENVAFPDVQANVVPAMALDDALDKGLETSMGFFGLMEGHMDEGDDEAGLTCMISNSRIPKDYEPSRFHIFGTGIYVIVKPKTASVFSGLGKHGGMPPIAPKGVTPSEDATRLMIVFYCPKAALSLDGTSMPLASLPNGMPLILGPEITNPYGARETNITGHGVWAHDAHVMMQAVSHLNLMVMSLLQTSSYVTEQMQTAVTIDINKFLGSFSIKADGGDIHPASWIMDDDNLVTISPAAAIIPNLQYSSLAASPKPFTMDDYSRCRQAEAICWIDLQEKRASIIARLQPVTVEEYQARRDAVYTDSGPLCRKAQKRTTQIQKSKTDANTPKTLNNPMDLLTQQTKCKRHDMTPVSKSLASSGLLNVIERIQAKGGKNTGKKIGSRLQWRMIHPPSPMEVESESETEVEPLPKCRCSKRNIIHDTDSNPDEEERQQSQQKSMTTAIDNDVQEHTSNEHEIVPENNTCILDEQLEDPVMRLKDNTVQDNELPDNGLPVST